MIYFIVGIALCVGFVGGWLVGRLMFSHEIHGALSHAKTELDRANKEVKKTSALMGELSVTMRESARRTLDQAN